MANRAPYWQSQTCPACPIAPPFAKRAPHPAHYQQRFSPALPLLRRRIVRFRLPRVPWRALPLRFSAHPPSSYRWRASPIAYPTPNRCCRHFVAPMPAQGLWFAPCPVLAAKPYPRRAFRHAPPKLPRAGAYPAPYSVPPRGAPPHKLPRCPPPPLPHRAPSRPFGCASRLRPAAVHRSARGCGCA